jgi:hypothetical protein
MFVSPENNLIKSDNSDNVLKNLSLDFKAGQLTAIIGEYC